MSCSPSGRYEEVPADPPTAPPTVGDELREGAIHVLHKNDRGTHTIPAHGLYPFRWLWDSSLIALGWATFDERRAWTELDASMSAQWDSGMVPHIDFANHADDYFPGPSIWNAGSRTGITQPPLTPFAAWECFKAAKDRELAVSAARALLPKLMASHRWLYDVRHAADTGLLVCLHPWETGLDNSPAWDRALKVVDASNAPEYQRSDTSHAGQAARPPQWFYDHSYALLLELRSLGYDTLDATNGSPFAVADVCFNSIAVRSSAALVELASELGMDGVEAAEWLELGEAGLASLWDDNAGLFMSYDWRADEFTDVPTSAGFMPLLTAALSDQQVGRLADVMHSWGTKANHLLPSVDPDHPTFDPSCYWRGPVWANVNWFVATGFAEHGRVDLAERLRTEIAELVSTAGFWEYFDPYSGAGLGGRDFSWTAALTLSWLPS